jgi:hypothetical protein
MTHSRPDPFHPASELQDLALDPALLPRLDAALEYKPHPSIPVDFAARVASRAATLQQRGPVRPLHLGRNLVWASTVLLAMALFLLAPHTAPSFTSLRFDAELLLLLELGALGWWMGRTDSFID